MADNRYLNQDGDWNNVANWSNAAKPAAADIWRLFNGTLDITTNMNQSATSFSGTGAIGPDFAGTLGTPSDPLNLGGTLAQMTVNSPRARSINLRVATVTQLIVRDTHTDDGAFYLTQGTATNFLARKGRGIRIGANATCTDLRIAWIEDQLQDVQMRIDTGATLTTVTQGGGQVICQADTGTLNIWGGEWIMNGGTEGDITTVNQYGGIIRWEPSVTGQNVTTLNGFGGLFDASGSSYEKTIATANLWTGHTLDIDNGVDTIAITNPINIFGNPTIIKDASRTITIEGIST